MKNTIDTQLPYEVSVEGLYARIKAIYGLIMFGRFTFYPPYKVYRMKPN